MLISSTGCGSSGCSISVAVLASNSVKSIVSCCEVFWVKPVEWWYGKSKEKWFGSLSDSEAKVNIAVTCPCWKERVYDDLLTWIVYCVRMWWSMWVWTAVGLYRDSNCATECKKMYQFCMRAIHNSFTYELTVVGSVNWKVPKYKRCSVWTVIGGIHDDLYSAVLTRR